MLIIIFENVKSVNPTQKIPLSYGVYLDDRERNSMRKSKLIDVTVIPKTHYMSDVQNIWGCGGSKK